MERGSPLRDSTLLTQGRKPRHPLLKSRIYVANRAQRIMSAALLFSTTFYITATTTTASKSIAVPAIFWWRVTNFAIRPVPMWMPLIKGPRQKMIFSIRRGRGISPQISVLSNTVPGIALVWDIKVNGVAQPNQLVSIKFIGAAGAECRAHPTVVGLFQTLMGWY